MNRSHINVWNIFRGKWDRNEKFAIINIHTISPATNTFWLCPRFLEDTRWVFFYEVMIMLLRYVFCYYFKVHDNVLMDLDCCCCSVTKSYPTPCDPIDCSPPGSSVHGILQARILEWVAMPSSRYLPDPGFKPVSLTSPALAGFTISTTWEVQKGHGSSSQTWTGRAC